MEFIAATHFPTNLWNTNEYQAFLPPRLLVEGDAIPFIGDFSPEQNKVLLSLCVLHKTNEFTGRKHICGIFLLLSKVLSLQNSFLFCPVKNLKQDERLQN